MTTARRAGATSLATLSACMVGFVVVHAMAPQWAQSAGLDFWQMPEAQAAQRRENEREAHIEAHADDLAQRIAAGDTVANAFIEGRIEWDAAVDQIVEINRGRDGFPIALEAQFYGVTDTRELHSLYLRAKVRTKVERDPTRQCEVMARITDR
jgi:hypothetical protein